MYISLVRCDGWTCTRVSFVYLPPPPPPQRRVCHNTTGYSTNFLAEKHSKIPPFSFTIHFRARHTPSCVKTCLSKPALRYQLLCLSPLKSCTRHSVTKLILIETASHSINLQIDTSQKSTLAFIQKNACR